MVLSVAIALHHSHHCVRSFTAYVPIIGNNNSRSARQVRSSDTEGSVLQPAAVAEPSARANMLAADKAFLNAELTTDLLHLRERELSYLIWHYNQASCPASTVLNPTCTLLTPGREH